MLERAIANGRAPALARIRRDGCYVDDCVAAFPSVTPVCAATITTGVGPDGHRIPSMNWYHREEGRYVEYGSSFSRVAPVRRPAVADRHRLPDERRAPLDRGRDRVRVARRRRRPHRRHHLPDLPRPASSTRSRTRPRWPGSSPRPCFGGRSSARGSCSTPTCTRAARPAAAASSGCRDPRPAHRVRGRVPGRERPVRLHAVLAPRQRRLVAQERTARPGDLDRGRRPPARAARCTPPAGPTRSSTSTR